MRRDLSNVPIVEEVSHIIRNLFYDRFYGKERFEQFPKIKYVRKFIRTYPHKTEIEIKFFQEPLNFCFLISGDYDLDTFIFDERQFKNFIENIYLNVAIEILYEKELDKQYEISIANNSSLTRRIESSEIKTGLLEYWESVERFVYLESTPHLNDNIYNVIRESIEREYNTQFFGNLNEQSNQSLTATEARMRNISGEELFENARRFIQRESEIWFSSSDSSSKQNKKAKLKAEELLKNNLSPSQLYEYQTKKEFSVIGGTTNNLYTIKTGTQINIIDHKKNKKLCFLPRGCNLPGDVMLAQKMMLENDEVNTLKIANEWDI